ncbi:hypothetical protein Ssi02_07870 [Sinosporangium siamense]|uniref:Uncharacterized protein n=1 Tax=Sinosporangium siamense TaxID=1367973 RepID=A0A919V581_9ACTN|nr:hypothetical protein Ssi02_07870 [Sinosporangium siamense]
MLTPAATAPRRQQAWQTFLAFVAKLGLPPCPLKGRWGAHRFQVAELRVVPGEPDGGGRDLARVEAGEEAG